MANVRSVLSLSNLPGTVDPVAAESEIRRALGDTVSELPDPDARAAAQLTVLDYLVRDMKLTDDQIDDLLQDARRRL